MLNPYARQVLVLIACLAVPQSLARTAEAQSYSASASFAIAPEFVQPAESGSAREGRDRKLHVAQRRARWLMTIGTGVIAGAIAGLGAWQLSDPGCDPAGNEPLYMPGVGAALVGAGGAALLAGGIVKIRSVPLGYKRAHPLTAGRVLGMIGGALLAGTLANFAVLGIGAGQWLTCANG